MRCPVCRADNNEGPACRRCKADLSLLFQLEECRSALVREAHQHAMQGRWSEATELAEQAHALRRDADTTRLIAIGHLIQRDFGKAWMWYELTEANS